LDLRFRPFRARSVARIASSATFISLLAAAGCSQFRGIPSHGGGKRFEEEQRAVVGAIRRSVACMDLSALQGRRTALIVTQIFTSGSGTTNWPGPQNLNLYANTNPWYIDYVRRTTPIVTGGNETRESRDERRHLAYASLSSRLAGSYRTANQHTEGDIAYLRSALEMRARHLGLSIVHQKPEVILHVLVDVLGTNRSRRDYMLLTSDELLASCELTYYAQDVKTGKLLFTARQTGARARYHERRPLLLPISSVDRSICHAKPIYFDSSSRLLEPPANGVDLSALPDHSSRAAPKLKPSEREELLEALYDRVRFHLESGNGEAAQDYIQRMRQIDPGYEGLDAIAEDVERMMEER
jgi:hypothetical protein